MAYPNITNLPSAQKPAGIKKVYIKNAAELWQTMGFIRNGELKITPYVTDNTYKKNLHINSYTFEAKFEMLQTPVTAIELIPSIVDGVAGVKNSFLFQLTDSVAISSGATAGWVTVSPAQVYATAKYVADGNPSTSQFIEITVKGTILGSALEAAVKAVIATTDFAITGTSATYASLGNYTLSVDAANAGKDVGVMASIKPNGFLSVELDDVLSAGTNETLSNIRNGKITMEFVSEEDSLGRPNVFGIDVNIEYESTLTDDVTLMTMENTNPLNTQLIVTMLDGKVFTFDQELGFQTAFENIGDFDKLRAMRFMHKGRILTSQLAGIVA